MISSDKTEVDEDEVLLEYASLTNEPLILSFVNADESSDSVDKSADENNKNAANNSQSTSPKGNLNFLIIFKKIS